MKFAFDFQKMKERRSTRRAAHESVAVGSRLEVGCGGYCDTHFQQSYPLPAFNHWLKAAPRLVD